MIRVRRSRRTRSTAGLPAPDEKAVSFGGDDERLLVSTRDPCLSQTYCVGAVEVGEGPEFFFDAGRLQSRSTRFEQGGRQFGEKPVVFAVEKDPCEFEQAGRKASQGTESVSTTTRQDG